MNKREHLINEEILAESVRVQDKGILSTKDALLLAKESYLDLVCINPKTTPMICRLMKYDKFLYDLKKKPKPKSVETKEIKFGPNTSEYDIEYRVKHIKEFLSKGHRIKLSMRFKGREMMFVDKGLALMLNLILELGDVCVVETIPKLEGKQIIGFLRPKKA